MSPLDLSQSMEWRLDKLYAGPDDPAWQADQERLEQDIEAFGSLYAQGQALQSAKDFGLALAAYERIFSLKQKLWNYVQLCWRVDTRNSELTARKQALESRYGTLLAGLAFFENAIAALPREQLGQWLQQPAIRKYRQFIAGIRRRQPFRMPEPAEAEFRATSGRQAWQDLHSQLTSSWIYSISPGQELSEAGMLAYLGNADPELRRRAYFCVLDRYRDHHDTLAQAYRDLIQDYAAEARLRGFDSTFAMQCFEQEIDTAGLLALLDTMNDQQSLYQRYLACIKKLGHKTQMALWDQATSLPDWSIPFASARDLICAAAEELDPDFATPIAELFNGQIHALDRPGKLGLAYCEPMIASNPFIQLVWRENLYSLRQLAHEVGHGLHFSLCRLHNHVLELEPAPFLTEIASTFNEYLVLTHLYEQSSQPERKIQCLLGLLGIFINAIFRQGMITRFELEAHAAGPGAEASLTGNWLRLNRALAQPEMEIPAIEAYGWARIPHVFFQPFYCANYLLSAMAVLHLAGQHQQDPAGFCRRYRSFLDAGGSADSATLLQGLELDLTRPGFAAEACAQLERWIEALEALCAA